MAVILVPFLRGNDEKANRRGLRGVAPKKSAIHRGRRNGDGPERSRARGGRAGVSPETRHLTTESGTFPPCRTARNLRVQRPRGGVPAARAARRGTPSGGG